MKKIYLSIIASAFMLSANAQLSLTKAFNEPVVADINTNQGYDSTAALPKTTGMNQVWNFSSLTTNTVVEVGTFTTVASTPNGANFSGSTLAQADGLGAYTYFKSVGSQYEIVGVDDSNAVIIFTNTAVAANWPVSYGYSNTDVFSGTAAINGTLTGTAMGTITTLGSGTGTLIIPGGTSYTNVLQIKTIQTLDVSLAGGLINLNNITTDYNYYHASQKFPLLTVSYENTSGSLPSSSATIKLNGNVVTAIKDLNLDATFSVFPNPAKNNVNLKLQNVNNANCKVEIINAIGASLKSIDLGNSSEISSSISISNLTAGMYFIKTTLGDKTTTKKIIVE